MINGGAGLLRRVPFLTFVTVKSASCRRARIASASSFDGPILLGLKRADLLFAVDDDAHGDALHAPRGKAAANLLRQKRAELVAY